MKIGTFYRKERKMHTLVIFTGIALGITLYIAYKDKENRGLTIGWGIVATFICVLVGAVILMLLTFAFVPTSVENVPLSTGELVSVKDQTGIQGSFVFASGTVSEEPYYLVYAKTESGGIQLQKLNAFDTEIFDTLDQPHIVEYREYTVCADPNWFIRNMTTCSFGAIRWGSIKYYIFVPPGTVVQSLALDLE